MIIDYSGIDASDDRKINRNDGLLPKVRWSSGYSPRGLALMP
jgi:hypothetical protein